MAKGKSWSTDEDVSLSKAWVSVSENAVTGSEQTTDKFWDTIHKVSCISNRSIASIKQKWSTSQHSLSKFLASVNQIEQLNQSGKTSEDLIDDAWELCKDSCKLEKHSCCTCFELLKLSPKWSVGADSAEVYSKRPMGNKESKLEEVSFKRTKRHGDAAADIGERLIANLEKKNAYYRDMLDLQLFSRPEVAEDIRADFLNKMARKRIEELNRKSSRENG